MSRSVFFVFGFLLMTQAFAYMDYAPNQNLMEQVESQPYRILPKNGFYTLAVDADFFKPVFMGANNFNLYKYDFYHGNGYWIDLRSEFRPHPDLNLNLKFDVTQGTSSNGPTYLAMIVPHVGVTFRAHSILGFEWEFRLSDIDRQTIGTGLFIEEKETLGGSVIGKLDDFTLKLMVDGTGSFRVDGGVTAIDAHLWNGLLGGTVLIQEVDTDFHAPQFTQSLYSKKTWSNGLGYAAESAMNSNAQASLLALEYKDQFENLYFSLKPQFRHYGKGILGSLPGKISHNYVSYDQNDKPFTTLMNIFAFGDHVETYSAQINLEYRFNSFYRIYSETELITYLFHDQDAIRAALFRCGLKFYPFQHREDEFGFLVGNKYLSASTTTSTGSSVRTYSAPNYPDFENKALFLKQLYWMINYSVKL
jgi:hypothetical protein